MPRRDGANPPERSFGELTSFSDKLLLRILGWCDGHSLLRVSGACRLGYALTVDQSVWRDLCLELVQSRGRVDGKIAKFHFKSNWKMTYFRPERIPLERLDSEVPTPLSACLPDTFYTPKPSRKQEWYSRAVDVASIPLKGHPIDRVNARNITPEEFFKAYDKPNKPVIVEGAAESWGWNTFTHRDILEEFRDTIFKTNGTTGEGRTLRMSYEQYTSYCKYAWGLGEKPMYIFDNKFEQRAPDLTKKYCIPPYFVEDLFNNMSAKDRPDYRWLLIGPQGSGAPFHTDPHMTHAWNVVTEGRKRIAFYPPSVIPPGVDKELIHTEYYAAKDTMEWYLEYYPKLSSGNLPMEGVVEAGEMVFIPSGWWHQVLNIAPVTIAVTQNVCSKGNFNRVWCELKKRGPRSLESRFRRDCVKNGYAGMFEQYTRPADMDSSDESDSSSDSSDSDTS